jgi:uncharacterized protein YbjT (DUF2867 family)
MIKNNERSILVTGATGSVGREVVKQLLAASSPSDHTIRQTQLSTLHRRNK